MFLACVFCHHTVLLQAQTRQYRIRSCVTGPSRGSPHAFGYHLRHEGKLHVSKLVLLPSPSSCNILVNVSSHFFESEQTPPCLCLPSFNSVQDRSTPRTPFALQAEYTVDSPAFHFSGYVFASVDLHTSPPGLVRSLHSQFLAVLRSSCLFESTSQDLELLERQFV